MHRLNDVLSQRLPTLFNRRRLLQSIVVVLFRECLFHLLIKLLALISPGKSQSFKTTFNFSKLQIGWHSCNYCSFASLLVCQSVGFSNVGRAKLKKKF